MPILRVVRSLPAALAATVTASRAASVPVPEAPDPILAAIEGHRRDFEELRRLLAEQDAAERELRRRARMGRGRAGGPVG
jgi:hypothetical protein